MARFLASCFPTLIRRVGNSSITDTPQDEIVCKLVAAKIKASECALFCVGAVVHYCSWHDEIVVAMFM